jgi:hypothetical protein
LIPAADILHPHETSPCRSQFLLPLEENYSGSTAKSKQNLLRWVCDGVGQKGLAAWPVGGNVTFPHGMGIKLKRNGNTVNATFLSFGINRWRYDESLTAARAYTLTARQPYFVSFRVELITIIDHSSSIGCCFVFICYTD